MYKRLKLNVKNVVSDSNRLFSCLVVPRSVPPNKNTNCCIPFKQSYQECTIFSKLSVLKPLREGHTVKPISSQIPRTGKIWLNPINIEGIFTKPYRYFHNSIRRFYYDVQTPQCPPPGPKPCAGKTAKDSPPSKDVPKGDACGGSAKKECPKPCGSRKMSTFTVPLNIYRHYAKKPPCPPRGTKGGGGGAARATGKGPICPGPQKKVPDCSGGGGRRPARGGNVCPPAKKVKDCPPSGRGGGGGGSGGGKRKVVCGSAKKSSSGPTSPSQSRKPKCPPPGSGGSSAGGGAKSGTGKPLIKKAAPCPPRGKPGSAGKTGSSGSSGKSGRPKCKK